MVSEATALSDLFGSKVASGLEAIEQCFAILAKRSSYMIKPLLILSLAPSSRQDLNDKFLLPYPLVPMLIANDCIATKNFSFQLCFLTKVRTR